MSLGMKEKKKKESIILVDPAMADNGKVYPIFNQEYVDKMVDLCKNADIIVPNITEACIMTNTNYFGHIQTKEEIESLLDKINNLGIDNIVLTSVRFEENKLGVATRTKDGVTSYYMSDEVVGYFHGTGDVFASALVGTYLNGFTLHDSAKISAELHRAVAKVALLCGLYV